jgi:hypothetical protein
MLSRMCVATLCCGLIITTPAAARFVVFTPATRLQGARVDGRSEVAGDTRGALLQTGRVPRSERGGGGWGGQRPRRAVSGLSGRQRPPRSPPPAQRRRRRPVEPPWAVAGARPGRAALPLPPRGRGRRLLRVHRATREPAAAARSAPRLLRGTILVHGDNGSSCFLISCSCGSVIFVFGSLDVLRLAAGIPAGIPAGAHGLSRPRAGRRGARCTLTRRRR